MKKVNTLLVALFLLSLPLAVGAMEEMKHGDHDKTEKMEHGSMEGMKHEGMKMDDGKKMDHDMQKGHDMAAEGADFVEIGKDTQDGVVATVKVKTYDEETMATMSKMGMAATHHVMVFFTDEKSGEPVAEGKAAIKVKGSEDTSTKPAMMMLMGDGFGADVTLEGMMITFEIGTKLEDGKKRQFEVGFHNM